MKAIQYPALTKSEYEVMSILWNSEKELLMLEILEQCQEKYKKEWKKTTMSSFISHLVAKKALEVHQVSRNYYYKAAIPKEPYIAMETDNMIDNWCEGSLADFASALYHNTSLELTEEQREHLRALTRPSQERTQERKD